MSEDPMRIAREAWHRAGVRPGPEMVMTTRSIADTESADLSEHIWECAVCGVQLNQMRTPDGSMTYLHTRSWVRYDHEPEPKKVPRSDDKLMLCDFCGRENRMKWAYVGDVIEQFTGNSQQNYGHIWSACDSCSGFIDDEDIHGLATHVMRVSHLARQRHEETRQAIGESIEALHRQFLATVYERRYIGPKIEPAQIRPSMMPKLQEGLLKFWAHPGLYDRIANKPNIMSVPGVHAGREDEFAVRYYEGQGMPRDVFERHAHHIYKGLTVDDTLYWISEDFTSLATIAGQDLEDFNLSREMLPSPFGLLVWARPIGDIERPYGTAGIRAISWTLVPGGVWFNFYILGDDADPTLTDVAGMRAEFGHLQAPNVGSGLPWGVENKITDDIRTSGHYLLTTLATFFLMQQPGVAQEVEAARDKKIERSYKRSGKKMPNVRIVNLRRHARPKAEHDGEKRGVSVRFMVRGHWRNQAYGPKRGLRRQLYISPFLKGPEDAPLKSDVKTVKVLR